MINLIVSELIRKVCIITATIWWDSACGCIWSTNALKLTPHFTPPALWVCTCVWTCHEHVTASACTNRKLSVAAKTGMLLWKMNCCLTKSLWWHEMILFVFAGFSSRPKTGSGFQPRLALTRQPSNKGAVPAAVLNNGSTKNCFGNLTSIELTIRSRSGGPSTDRSQKLTGMHMKEFKGVH